jgi:phosphoribosylformimino-5-aminoimidazole carboxamide ribotide isomerase
MRIIPAIDLIDGKAVRLEKGDYARKKVYNEDPLEVAKAFEAVGLRYLHLVDLDGAKAGRFQNWKVLERICGQTGLAVDTGGGIKTDDDLRIVFESGAQQANIGSLAVKDREQMLAWLATYGGERLILSADVRDKLVAVAGWQEQTELEVVAFIEGYQKEGIRTAVVTDIAKDGMLAGSSLDLYRELREALPDLDLVASGGVTSLQELEELQALGLGGAIIGKAIYEGRIGLEELGRIEVERNRG